ncbi:hypothetical protein, partial [Streptomyces odonnellii]|uniref:hypothetical protein n=1 Tax=Streptomyces odonnellii TaxID=1417980 RepID=UPI0038CD25C7
MTSPLSPPPSPPPPPSLPPSLLPSLSPLPSQEHLITANPLTAKPTAEDPTPENWTAEEPTAEEPTAENPVTEDPSLRHLLDRVVLVEERVRRAVAARRETDPNPDDAFRGLYLTDEAVSRLLDARPQAP